MLLHASEATTKRAKGVQKSIVKKFSFESYNRVYLDEKPLFSTQYSFKAHKFEVFLECMNKNSISLIDVKRKWDSKNDSKPLGWYDANANDDDDDDDDNDDDDGNNVNVSESDVVMDDDDDGNVDDDDLR